jgi:hypothetical protein
MAAAGSAAGVRVPRVLGTDGDTGAVHYEHVECPVSLLDLMSSREVGVVEILNRVAAAGEALAGLHRALPVEGLPRRRRSHWFRRALGQDEPGADGRLVLQHGDFGYSNIRYSLAGELVVIDPSPNRYVTVDPLNVDHPELDLALVGSNFLGRTVRPRALARTVCHGPELFAALVEGYERVGPRVDRVRLRAYTMATIGAYARWCGRGRPELLVPLARLLDRNLP